MAISRTDCIRALQEAGAPAVEAAGIIDRMMREKRDLQAAGKNSPQELSRAWSKLQADNKRLAAMKRRQAALNIVRRNEARAFLASVRAQGFTSLDGLQAMLVGSSKRFDGARASISFQRKGIFASWTVPMIRELEAVGDGTALTLLREDKAFHDDVFREMRSPHSTGNDDARAVADIFARYGEQAIDRQNANGSDIRKRKGWTPQIHDEHKMLQAGKEAWVDFILARLDRSRTFGADAFPDEEARKILRETYSELVTGEDRTRRLHPEDSAATAPDSRERGSRVTIMSKARVLHFRDADAAIEYHDTFGRGNLFDAMIHQLDAAARRVSLAERLGPNPRAMVMSLVEDERTAIRGNLSLSEEEKNRQIRQLDSAFGHNRFLPGKGNNWLAELTGETNRAASPTLARAGYLLRSVQTLSKLGSAALASVSDVGTKAASMRVNGLTWGEAIQESVLQYVRRYSARQKEIAGQTGAFLDYLSGELAARWDADASLPGLLADLNNAMFKYSGLNWITEKGRSAMTLWLSRHIGAAAGKAFDQLDEARRAMLRYHGVDAPRWEVLRHMIQRDEGGTAYFAPVTARDLPESLLEPLLPETLQQATFARRVQESRTIRRRIKADNRRRMGEDPEAARTPLPAAPDKAAWMEARRQAQDNLRDRLETDSLAMLADEVAFGIIEADDATRAVTRQGTRPGTPAGEMWRLVMQFKSFPIAYMQRILGGRRWIRGERQQGLTYGWTARSVGQGLGRDIPGVVCFAIISLALGYASQTLNDFVRGKTPRDPRKGETWAAAAARSGGLGIYGDFLFGKLNRYGNTAVETLAGPVATSMLNAAFAIPGHALRGDWEAAGKDAAAIALNNAPFVNFWMTRGVLEWAFLYHVRESLSPGVLRRMERQAQKEYGQRYFVSPTQDRLRPW